MVRLNGEAKSQVEVSIFLHPMFLQWLNLSQRKSVAEKTIVIFLCVITNPNQRLEKLSLWDLLQKERLIFNNNIESY